MYIHIHTLVNINIVAIQIQLIIIALKCINIYNIQALLSTIICMDIQNNIIYQVTIGIFICLLFAFITPVPKLFECCVHVRRSLSVLIPPQAPVTH